ncbi:MAG: hypothetical protein WED15_10130 [Akkermansiaceae bacterium]
MKLCAAQVIGLDLDNTIVCYNSCFHALAVERCGVPPSVPMEKNAVRKFLREAGRESEWTTLQGFAYGSGMGRAQPFESALAFIREAMERGQDVKIISHRTKYPIAGDETDLHQSAMAWLMNARFVGAGALTPEDVFFETTKEAKLDRIRSEGCSVFLDDLPEILESPHFPENVEGWLFAPNAAPDDLKGRVVRDWRSFARQVL